MDKKKRPKPLRIYSLCNNNIGIVVFSKFKRYTHHEGIVLPNFVHIFIGFSVVPLHMGI